MVTLRRKRVKLLRRKNAITLPHTLFGVRGTLLVPIQHEIDRVGIEIGGTATYVNSFTTKGLDLGNGDLTAGGGGTVILGNTKLRHG